MRLRAFPYSLVFSILFTFIFYSHTWLQFSAVCANNQYHVELISTYTRSNSKINHSRPELYLYETITSNCPRQSSLLRATQWQFALSRKIALLLVLTSIFPLKFVVRMVRKSFVSHRANARAHDRSPPCGSCRCRDTFFEYTNIIPMGTFLFYRFNNVTIRQLIASLTKGNGSFLSYMDHVSDKPSVCVSKLIIPNDDCLGSDELDDNRRQYELHTSPRVIDDSINKPAPILGRHFKLPDFSKSFDPDPPKLDSSLAYIPVYTHLITYDLVPIERPKTPPFIKMLKLERTMESKNPVKSAFKSKAYESDDYPDGDETINRSRRSSHCLKFNDTSPETSTSG